MVLYILADIIHYLTIIIVCDMFFGFKRKKVKHEWLMQILNYMAVAGISAFVYLYNNYYVELPMYILTIILLLFIHYKEALHIIVVTAIWTLFTLSMINTMVSVLFDMFIKISGVDADFLSKLIINIISIVLIYIVSKIYRNYATVSLKNVGISNLIGFTILLIVDTFVVTAITVMNTEINWLQIKTTYFAAIILVIIGIFIQLASVILLFTQRNVYKEKEELTDKYLNEQKNHYEYLENREKETKKFRHDLKSHMEMISSLAKERQYDRMNAYLEQMNIRIDDFGNVVTVQNGIVDAIINQYYAKAQECGVSMEVRGRFPVDCAIDAFDLCTIFSNVLSNALEAAKETEEKSISVECVYTDMVIMIIVSNSYKPDATNGSGQWRTKKHDLDYHGYGLENIKDSVAKYKGGLDIETKDNIFTLRILFQNMEKQIDENSNCG